MGENMNLKTVLETRDPATIASYLKDNDLTIVDGKIVHQDLSKITNLIEFWDKRQLVKKINLNS